jgi:hypothetical protein
MPYLQLDVSKHYPTDIKRALARRMGDLHARIMQTTPEMLSDAKRELPEGSPWSCRDGEPEPGAGLNCDIRRGRMPEQRVGLAQALVEACIETLELRSGRLSVEFTRHAGNEMYRAGRG